MEESKYALQVGDRTASRSMCFGLMQATAVEAADATQYTVVAVQVRHMSTSSPCALCICHGVASGALLQKLCVCDAW